MWEWQSNMQYCDKGCRIIVGWNTFVVNIMVLHSARQSMLCILESVDNQFICFITLVYAANSGVDRRELWKELNKYKSIVNGRAWAIGGDFNVTLNINKHSAGSSCFSTDMKEFRECTVKDGWKMEVTGFSMFVLSKKLKALKHPNNLNWGNENLVEKVKRLKDVVKNIQIAIDNDPHNKSLRNEESMILKAYMEAVVDEEKLLFQKCKVKWLAYGDKNNYFFHKVLKGRYQRSRIQSILDENGQRFNGDQVVDLTALEACSMVRDVTDKVVKDAMFGIDDNKAPGPDGFSDKFFKKAWSIVGKDVCNAIKELFSSGKMLGELNATIISLVPRLPTPLKVIKDTLEEFGNCSSLLPNFSKSTIFFGGINGEGQQTLLNILPFTKGSLPVKYIGVPLITKRLGVSDFLESIHMYWSFVFLLPKTVVNDINKVLKSFLWGHGESSKGSVKVSIVKLREGSIWVIQKESTDCWGWRNLLDIKDMVVNHIKYTLGDGQGTFMWINKNGCMVDTIENGGWKLLEEWYDTLPNITSIVVPIFSNRGDTITWVGNDGATRNFSMKQVYCYFRDNTKEVRWGPLWGSFDMMVCALCKKNDESHDHLFFKCDFAKDLWTAVQKQMEFYVQDVDWNSIVSLMANNPYGNSIGSVIKRLCFGATMAGNLLLVFLDFKEESGIALKWRGLGAIACIMMPFLCFILGYYGCGLNDQWITQEGKCSYEAGSAIKHYDRRMLYFLYFG
ncbi:RNA-directed DNA polymerase, eukaryota, reverse transcriptase zinc-binding domain protein [Tanacetum coccineum]